MATLYARTLELVSAGKQKGIMQSLVRCWFKNVGDAFYSSLRYLDRENCAYARRHSIAKGCEKTIGNIARVR